MKEILSSTVILSFFVCCQTNNNDVFFTLKAGVNQALTEVEIPSYKLPNIDLTHWKVTLPVGSPASVHPPEIFDYATSETLKPFFYNDSIDGALVFYTYPDASTSNSSYSRTELREQMVSGSDHTNWTFAQGGRLKATLAVPDISEDRNGRKHRTIVMQIHGRLTNSQRDMIGQKDNNAPPIMKVYWVDGYIRLKSKILKNINDSDLKALKTDAWEDDKGYTFSEYVGTSSFTLEIVASDGAMEVILNEKNKHVYQGSHIKRWGIFENYFKAGNYLMTRDENAYAKVKFYKLDINHE